MDISEEGQRKVRQLIKDLPDLETLKCRVENLKKEVRFIFSHEEIGDLFWKRTGLVTTTFDSLLYKHLTSFQICRIRKDVRSNENITSVKPFTYRDPTTTTENQRGTLKGSSAFFCATDVRTVSLEGQCKKGEVVYIGFWNVDSQAHKWSYKVKYVPLLPANTPVENPWSYQAVQVNKYFADIANSASSDKFAQVQYLLEFTADFSSQEDPPYPLASWLGNDILEKNEFSQFILYPSCKAD